MLRLSLRVLGFTYGLAAIFMPQDSRAWEQTTGQDGGPIAWPSSCFHYSLHIDGTSDMPFDALQTLTRRAFDTWEDVSCSYYYFVETEPARIAAEEFNLDRGNVNLLVFRDRVESWPHDPRVIALTSVHFDKNTNEILDADIEFNAAYNDFGSTESYPPQTGLIDYLSTVTHEIGHTVGLEHPFGHPEATMAPYGSPGEIIKRDLAEDDIQGLCSVYPAQDDPRFCRPPYCGLDLDGTSTACRQQADDGEGCAFAPSRRLSLRLLRLLAALLE